MPVGEVLRQMIIQYLEEACEKLREELRKVSPKIYVTHDSVGIIEVYGDPSIKAYVPKKYNGWPVQFAIWDGEEIILDMDEMISGG